MLIVVIQCSVIMKTDVFFYIYYIKNILTNDISVSMDMHHQWQYHFVFIFKLKNNGVIFRKKQNNYCMKNFYGSNKIQKKTDKSKQ